MAVNLKNKAFKSISRRLVLYIVLCSSMITLVITAYQLRRDYLNDIAVIEHQFEAIKSVHLKSISESLWATDVAKLRTIIEGVSNLRDVIHVAIVEDGKILVAEGEKRGTDTILRNFPIAYQHRGITSQIGILEVVVDLGSVYKRIVDRGIVILISNAIKTVKSRAIVTP